MVLFCLIKANSETEQAKKIMTLRHIYGKEALRHLGNAYLINTRLENNFFVFFEMELESEELKQEVLKRVIDCGAEIYKYFCLSIETNGVLYTTHTNPMTTLDSMIRYCCENLPVVEDFLSYIVDYQNDDGVFRSVNIYLEDRYDERRDNFMRVFQKFTIEHKLHSVERNAW